MQNSQNIASIWYLYTIKMDHRFEPSLLLEVMDQDFDQNYFSRILGTPSTWYRFYMEIKQLYKYSHFLQIFSHSYTYNADSIQYF